jgi:hypothetical protein
LNSDWSHSSIIRVSSWKYYVGNCEKIYHCGHCNEACVKPSSLRLPDQLLLNVEGSPEQKSCRMPGSSLIVRWKECRKLSKGELQYMVWLGSRVETSTGTVSGHQLDEIRIPPMLTSKQSSRFSLNIGNLHNEPNSNHLLGHSYNKASHIRMRTFRLINWHIESNPTAQPVKILPMRIIPESLAVH